MSGDLSATSSFGDPNAQPPTPRQTPTSAVFPSPVFGTPQLHQNQAQFGDAASWTPRFAEDYTVFNSTPGNLRGSQGPFPDFVPITPSSQDGGHKRFLSTDSAATPHASANPFSPDPNIPLPPVDPAHRLLSTPQALNLAKDQSNNVSDAQQSPSPSLKRFSKKARRGTLQGAEQAQVATPPPTASKGKRLAPKLNMQDEQNFSQPDFGGGPQPQDLSFVMANPAMFSYPLSAPVTAPDTFWDTSAMAMSMDMDFNAPVPNIFQPGTPAHRHSISFDWNSDVQLFQEPQEPLPPVNQENTQPVRRERVLAPKPPATEQSSGPAIPATSMAPTYGPGMEDPFGMMGPAAMPNGAVGGVDPGMLFGRPQTSTVETSSKPVPRPLSFTPILPKEPKNSPVGSEPPRPASAKDAKQSKLPDRGFASSPIKPQSVRPGLGRSFSENRGRKSIGRGQAAHHAPQPRPLSQAGNGSGVEANRAPARPSGRISPLKKQQRLAGLASIPESASRPASRASVRFTIDSRGRARAETTVPSDDLDNSYGISRRGSTAQQDLDAELDESSSDDEPIIIPSRNTSFNASFALPDPRKPVGSMFHSSRRSVSDKSTSTLTTSESANGTPLDGDSEAETVMNDAQGQGGDAANELLKVMEDRQKRSSLTASDRAARLLSINPGVLHEPSISPSSLTDPSWGIRCTCNRNGGDENDGFMIQCESCEKWLHGDCVNITRRSMPRVYICAFCAQTPNMRGGRMRDTSRGGALDFGGSSPLANKSFRSLR